MFVPYRQDYLFGASEGHIQLYQKGLMFDDDDDDDDDDDNDDDDDDDDDEEEEEVLLNRYGHKLT